MRSLVLLASLAVYNAHIWTGDSGHPRALITGGYWDHTNWGGELPTREWADAGRGTVSGGRISFELKQH